MFRRKSLSRSNFPVRSNPHSRSNSRSRKSASAIGLAVFASLGAGSALAQTQNSTWTDGAGGSTWNTAGNWSPSGVPNNGTGGFTDYNVVIGSPSPTNLVGNFTIDSMTLGTSGLLNIAGGSSLALNGPTLTLNGTLTVNNNQAFAGTSILFNGVTTSGAGAIVLNDDANANTAALNGTLTLAAANSITGQGAINAILNNNGTVNANAAGHVITLGSNSETNNGLFEASTGGTLSITNITITQGTSGQITANTSSLVNLNGSIISGGTLNGAGPIQVLAAGATFTSLTNNAAVNQVGNATITVNGNLSNTATITVNSNQAFAGTGMTFNGGTISGGGTILLNDDATNTTAAINGTVTLAAANTISGQGAMNAVFTNNGLLNANVAGHVITLESNNETNNNLLESSTGGTLSIANITITQGTSGQITANTSSLVNLNGSTISGGTLSGAGLFQVQGGGATFTNLTNNANVNEFGGVNIAVNGNFSNTATITVNSNQAYAGTEITFSGGTISGGGTIALNDDATTTTADVNGTVILSAGNTIQGEGAINAAFTNNGVVNANVSGHQITLQSSNETNNNLLESSNGGTLSVVSITIAQGTPGQFTANTGSFLNLSSATITGGSVTVSSGGTLQMASSNITGGTLTVSTAAAISVASGTNTIGGLTSNGSINLVGGSILDILGNVPNTGTITVNSNQAYAGTTIQFNGGTLSGGGAIVLNDDSTTTTADVNGSLTLAFTNTITGDGAINALLINNGVVNANQSGHQITLQTNNETNNNLLEASAGGTLSAVNITITQGTAGQITANTASLVNLSGASITGGSVSVSMGGFMQLAGSSISGGTVTVATAGTINVLSGTNTIGGLTNNGRVNLLGGSIVNVLGNLIDNGTITVNSNDVFAGTTISFNGGNLSGTGTLALNDDGNSSTADLNGTVIQSAGHTIDGEGTINAALTNNGVVNANQSGHALTMQTGGVTNNNLLEASTGGTLAALNTTINQGTAGQITANTASLVNLSSVFVTNGTVTVNAGGTLQMAGSSIVGGTVTVSTAGLLTLSSGTNTLGGFTNNGTTNLLGGAILDILGNVSNTGTITVNSNQVFAGTSILFNGGTLSGGGSLVLNDDGNSNTAVLNGSLTLALTNTISGEGVINAMLTNFGIVNANQTAHLITLQTNGEVNNNLLEASSGGTLAITNITITQGTAGQITSNTNSLVNISVAGINGGSLNGPGLIQLLSSGNSFTNVTNNAGVNELGGQSLVVNGNLDNTGTITVNSNQAFAGTGINFMGGTLSGGGAIVLNDDAATTTATVDGTLTQVAGNTISGQGAINAALTNNGVVNANVTGHQITLQTFNKINNNLFEATNGGTLALSNVSVTQGTAGQITATGAGSVVSLSGSSVTAGLISIAAGNTLQFISSPSTVTSPIVSNGSVKVLTGSSGAPVITGPITGNGSLNMGANSYLRLASSATASTFTSITSASGSGIDVTTNRLVVNYGSPANDPITTISQQLANAYNAGLWTGNAGTLGVITSSTAQMQGGPALAVGVNDGNTDPSNAAAANQIVIRYTLAGDANLDGLVNFQDLVTVVQNFNKPGTDWAHGNFAYGASTNFNDLVTVVQNFNKILTPPATSGDQLGGSTIPLSASIQVQPGIPAMPEPAAVSIVALGATTLLKRRRRAR